MADWSATETFESYGLGDLNGDNGGSGWSSVWTQASGVMTVVSTPVNSGTRSLNIGIPVGGQDYSRTLTTGVTSGILRCFMLSTTLPTTSTGWGLLLYDGTTPKATISWSGGFASGQSGNNIYLDNVGASSVIIQATPLANTWYQIDLQFDQVNSQMRANVNGGPWSSFVPVTFTSITKVRLNTQSLGTAVMYLDDIGVGTGPVTNSSHLLGLLGVGG